MYVCVICEDGVVLTDCPIAVELQACLDDNKMAPTQGENHSFGYSTNATNNNWNQVNSSLAF